MGRLYIFFEREAKKKCNTEIEFKFPYIEILNLHERISLT